MQGTAVDQGIVGYAFAGAQVQFDLITHGDDQYLAYYNSNNNITVKHRKIGATDDATWTQKVIMTGTYNPDPNGRSHTYKDDWDSHNWLRLAVDSHGNLHLAGDNHRTAMRYWRTTTPGDVTTLTERYPLSLDTRERLVTYPEFIAKPNGDLGFLTYRSGNSGNGDGQVYKWNEGSKTWTQASRPFAADSAYFPDGHGNAYHEIFATPDGWYHIVFNWRGASHYTSNSKLSYVKTQDFVTFYTAAGVAVGLPIRGHATAPTVDPIPVGPLDTSTTETDDHVFNGFVNGEYQFAQHGGAVWIAYVKKVAGADQMFVARAGADGVWQTHQMTTVGGIGGMGNGFLDNWMTVIDADTLAVDFALGNKGPTRRLVFPIATWNQTTYAPGACPQYYPDAVYPVPDSQPYTSVHARTRADSRSYEATSDGAVDRRYLASRPYAADRLYVVSWLAGQDRHKRPDGSPETGPVVPQSVIDAWPNRPITMFKITY